MGERCPGKTRWGGRSFGYSRDLESGTLTLSPGFQGRNSPLVLKSKWLRNFWRNTGKKIPEFGKDLAAWGCYSK